MTSRSRLDAALDEHREALEAFVARARRVAEADWVQPRAPGKWSPSEITEHLRLSLEKLEQELRGGPAIPRVLPAWKRFLLRQAALPWILRRRRFPRGARAPREVRPASAGPPRDRALSDLPETLERLAAASGGSPGRRRLTHPYFGRLRLDTFHRLLALHTLHHREQLPEETP